MNTTERGITALLKSAVTGEKRALGGDFDLAQAMPLIKSHAIASLAYEGALRCGISAQTAEMQALFRGSYRTLLQSEAQLAQLRKLFAAFDEQGIDYLPLKGVRMKALYPKPELRVMGDADILIRMEQYAGIEALMEQLGFEAGGESDHELIWKNNALYLELHKHLIPSYNRDLYAYFGTGWQRAVRRAGGCHEMTAEDEFIFLFTHFAKHFRDGGIGCRHVLDLWVYLRAKPELAQDYIRAELEKMRLGEFYANTLRLLQYWFEDGDADPAVELMSGFIFSGGSFATDTMQALFRTARHTQPSSGGRLAYLRDTALPSAKALEGKYRVLKKAPWLLPAVWVYRPFYKALFEAKTLKKQKNNLAALESEKLDESRRFLRMVGFAEE